MIYKMSKYSFVIYHREYEAFLEKLRDLGVVHIEASKNAKEERCLSDLLSKRKDLDAFKRRIEMKRSSEAEAVVDVVLPGGEAEGAEILQKGEELLRRSTHLQHELAAKLREVNSMDIWGEFAPSDIRRLHDAGYDINFFSCPPSAYKSEWESEFGAIVINTVRSVVYFITVTPTGHSLPEVERVVLPACSLSRLREEYAALAKLIQENDRAIIRYADTQLNALIAYDKVLADRFNFGNAILQADRQADERLMVLTGWIPAEDDKNLEQSLSSGSYYYVRTEIGERDLVPIKLRNNAYARLFEPITKMFSLPNYGELDPTPLFAPFFMLFFALCFGDAGYGVVLFAVATILRLKSKPSMKGVCTLFQWLGGTAVVIGLLVGTCFGMVMPWASEGGVFGPVKPNYFLNQDNLMYLSVVLGLVQILFGKVVAGVKISTQRGLKYGLGTFAWVFIIIGCFALLGLPKLTGGRMSPIITYVLLAIVVPAALVAFFYNTPGKNPILNFGSGLWNTYNMASGLLGDTLSYIRLFAIGLTSGILGGVFNDLAWNMTEGSIFMRILVMPLILLVGHGINFGLAMIGSLVHPLRLTFVEYYKNAEFEGGGRMYIPFKKS